LIILLLLVSLADDSGVRREAPLWIDPIQNGASHPSPEQVRAAYAPSDARLLDRRGEVLHELRVDPRVRRLRWTPLAEISPALLDAVLRSEDRRFRQHGGVDPWAVAAAGWTWLRGGPRRGASTISMQLAALLDPELRRGDAPRSGARKWAQMRAAWALEEGWSKDEILEAYLNLVTFRGELQGVAAASAVLFDKQPHGLSQPEAIVLAALLRAPNADRATLLRRSESLSASLRPDPARYRSRDRQGAVGCAVELGQPLPDGRGSESCETGGGAPVGETSDGVPLSEAGDGGPLAEAVARVAGRPRGSGPRVKHAPHVARRLLRPGEPGDVRATLDASLQRFAAAALRQHLLALRGRNAADGAVLVVDNDSGEVLAYVGSSGELSPAPEVDGVRARRQAGSALKPFLYATALEERLLTPATLLDDAPLEIPVGGGLYRPQNYDEQFRGLVSVRSALAASLNVPAVRALQVVGPEGLARSLRQLGIALDRPGDDYGPSLALGSADVTLWELVGAYRALARGGVWQPLRLRREGAGAAAPCAGDGCRVFSPQTSFLVADMLADRESRAHTFGLESPLATRFWSAVKTGTSKDMRDNWCIGFSPRYTVGVWVGNFSGRPMHDVSGVSGAAPVWLEVMERLHRDGGAPAPTPPPGVVARRVSFAASGSGAAEPARREWFLEGTERPWDGAAPRPPLADAPRIVSPAPDTVIALDPEIPAARQRVVLEARGAGALVLDGLPLGGTRHLWSPRPGRHSLALVDHQGRALAGVAFLVRGEGNH